MIHLSSLRHDSAINKRIEFAGRINDLVPHSCWADLVMWAFGDHEFEDCFSQACRVMGGGLKPGEAGWCGKCVGT